MEKAYQHALKLRELAPDDAQTYRLLSRIFFGKRMYDESRRCVERALSINPNDCDIIANRGVFHLFYGDFEESIGWFDRVLELHSETPHTVDIMRYWKAFALFSTKDYRGSIAMLRTITALDFVKSQLLAACHARIGERDAAQGLAQAALRTYPDLRLSTLGLWKAFRQEEAQQHLFNALHAAGLPE